MVGETDFSRGRSKIVYGTAQWSNLEIVGLAYYFIILEQWCCFFSEIPRILCWCRQTLHEIDSKFRSHLISDICSKCLLVQITVNLLCFLTLGSGGNYLLGRWQFRHQFSLLRWTHLRLNRQVFRLLEIEESLTTINLRYLPLLFLSRIGISHFHHLIVGFDR